MIKQLFKFAIVGGIASVVDIGILAMLKEIFGVDVLIASAISFCVSVTVNYILSMRFVFKGKKQNKVNEFIVFVLLSIGGLGLNQIILWAGTECTSLHYLVVKFFAIFGVMIYNFVTRKVFLEAKDKKC